MPVDPLVALVLWASGILFVLTLVVSLFSAIEIPGKKLPLPRFADEKVKGRMYHVLFVEIVAFGLAVLSIGQDTLDRNTAVVEDVSTRLEQLSLSAEEWSAASLDWLDEPSGLTPSHLTDTERQVPVALAVDDDEPGVFVLESIETPRGRVAAVRRILSFLEDGEPLEPDDLEGVTHDGLGTYYAITSHRRLDDGHWDEALFLEFVIDENWQEPEGAARVSRRIDLTEKLPSFLSSQSVRLVGGAGPDAGYDEWRNGSDKCGNGAPDECVLTEYYAEVEGLAYSPDGRLFIGLKWPLVDGNAILLTYDPEQDAFDEFHTLDLGGRGISGLYYDSSARRLLVTANPPESPREDEAFAESDMEQFYGKSALYSFTLDGGVWTVQSLTTSHAEGSGKLEGIGLQAGTFWMVYDGAHAILKIVGKPFAGSAP